MASDEERLKIARNAGIRKVIDQARKGEKPSGPQTPRELTDHEAEKIVEENQDTESLARTSGEGPQAGRQDVGRR